MTPPCEEAVTSMDGVQKGAWKREESAQENSSERKRGEQEPNIGVWRGIISSIKHFSSTREATKAASPGTGAAAWKREGISTGELQRTKKRRARTKYRSLERHNFIY
ncbi:hypothetical protein MGYG_08846 [Nannizzia gypsea CBS 118893]|uniref:Uncharacterized protein n=1 Tax=Arthroderma gypseum (strain ATCC MYA-4604 / CBS 118893) TaxID=535722 RepID=E4V755_ARTGP|nr:hypothetical protein MGYG_08846 [Nannizzia gypsea CBS 118893]EFQ96921.1 hypothetical protein MGYG_08846 [Nannizzia gypsea CBS 118893]